MNKYYLFKAKTIVDDRSNMCVSESLKDFPFVIKRFFYDYNFHLKDSIRGNHSNRFSRFVFICLKGSCSVDLDDGTKKQTFVLDDPSQQLFIDKMVWKKMYNFSRDCVLLVLSDSYYDKNEYINDYDSFLRECK